METRSFICILLFATAVQINGQSTTEWTSWGSCSATCRFGSTSPTQTRSRTCTGSCNNVLVMEMRNCNDVSCQVIPCNTVNISYIIVIDSSSSVKTSLPDEWSQEKTFVKNFAAQLGLGTNPLIRVGVVNYGTEAEIVANCDSVQTSNLANFNAFIDGLPRQLGGTAINDALLQTRALYQGDGCNRQNEVRIVLFLTDGFENVEFNDRTRFLTENRVRSEAGFCVGAVGPDPRINDLLRLTGMSYITRTANFEELSQLDVSVCYNQILNKYCAVPGSWTAWSNFGACSISCGANGTRTRNRQCVNPITNAVQNDCPGSATESEVCFMGHCVGSWTQWSAYGVCSATCHFGAVGSPPTQMRTRACVGATGGQNCGGGDSSETQSCNVRVPCPGNWGQWGAFGACSELCQSDVNNSPTMSRTRTCLGGTFNGGCVGSATDSVVCNARVPCQGSLTQWSGYGACSASCQLGLVAPTQQRQRSCLGSTFSGNCNNAALTETTDCNVEVPCPGNLTNWGQWGACSENCQSNPNQVPTRMRSRQCINVSFGGNCGGAALTMTGTCNVGVGCEGMWSNWGAYESCSETCQSNVNTAPTQIRRRTCNGGTFGQTCPGSSVDTRNCMERVSCPGNLNTWSAYSPCSASCQLGLNAPTQQRTRSCIGATFGGNCNNAALSETTDCNVEVQCPGNLTNWGQWGACSESCQSNLNQVPTRMRSRQCINVSFGGNCGGAALTMTGTCNSRVGCEGVWSSWGAYESCSETCQSNVNTAPTQIRRRTCNGGTFGQTCPGSSVDTRNCMERVSCPGNLNTWSAYSPCSASCQLGLNAPTQQRTRSCIGATFGGNCNNAALSETTDCNVEVRCPGDLSQWSDFSMCPESCQTGATPAQHTRTRNCTNTSFGGNCGGAVLTESQDCSAGVACPGTLTQWSSWSDCSATCHAAGSSSPMRNRTRLCQGATLGDNCGGANLIETVNCNFQVPCQGRLTTWGPWTACSHTCQSDGSTIPSRSRARFCVETSFGGNCLGANLQQSENCNVGVICPVLGTWTAWGQWSTCSKTCDMGMRTRSRNCTDPFPASAGNDCVGSSTSSSTCKLADCPVACPVTKRCNCSLTTQFPTTAPTLSFFNIDDATIHAAINTMSYWTEAVQNQICESCNLQRLQVSVNTVNSHVTQVKNVLTRLNEIKLRLKDIINCNKNVYIGADLWALYDYLYTRCTMLKGIHIELSACKLRFDAANNSCKKFGWFHELMNQVYRKL